MQPVTLRKVSSTHSNLRTDEVYGHAAALPIVGEPFVMFADPIDPTAAVRIVKTSLVRLTTTTDIGFTTYYFETENSKYALTLGAV